MPRSDGGTTLDELTRADIEASRALAAWEWAQEVVLVEGVPKPQKAANARKPPAYSEEELEAMLASVTASA